MHRMGGFLVAHSITGMHQKDHSGRQNKFVQRARYKKTPANTMFTGVYFLIVGVVRFELTTSRPPAERATKLRHTPIAEVMHQRLLS